MIKTCERCGREFDTRARNAKYCVECRPIVRREQIVTANVLWRKRNPDKVREYQRCRKKPRRIKTCQRCGVLYQAVKKSKYCVVCSYEVKFERDREYHRRWRDANIEHLREYWRRYKATHREQIREYQCRYRDNVKRKLIREILSAEAVNRDD